MNQQVSVEDNKEQGKPTIILLSRVELGGAANAVAALIAGEFPLKSDYQRTVRQVVSVVKTMASMQKHDVPVGSTLSLIEAGIYVDDQEVYYKFHFYAPPPEPIQPVDL